MNISKEYKSYIIGFLHGDGSYYVQDRNRGRISVELNIRDIDILYKIKDIIVDCKIETRERDTNFKKESKSCILYIFNRNIRSYLNIPIGSKSRIISIPKDVDIKNYLRGLYDADGSIGITNNNRPFISLCTSSDSIKNSVINFIKNNLSKTKKINRNKRDKVYNIVLYDEDAIKYASILYENATIYIDRKYKKFTEMVKWNRSIPKRSGTKISWDSKEDKIVMSDIPIKNKMEILCRSKSSILTRAWRLRQQ